MRAALAAEVEQGGSNSVVESQPSKLSRLAGVSSSDSEKRESAGEIPSVLCEGSQVGAIARREPAAEILSGAKDLGKIEWSLSGSNSVVESQPSKLRRFAGVSEAGARSRNPERYLRGTCGNEEWQEGRE